MVKVKEATVKTFCHWELTCNIYKMPITHSSSRLLWTHWWLTHAKTLTYTQSFTNIMILHSEVRISNSRLRFHTIQIQYKCQQFINLKLKTNLCCSDRETEGIWRNYYTNEKINISSDITNITNGGNTENCAILVLAWNGYADWICQANKVYTSEF